MTRAKAWATCDLGPAPPGRREPFVTPFRVTASHDEHLRILLSRMYEFNSSWLPVLDPDQQFLGEVTQESIADYLSSSRSRGGGA